MKITTMTKNKTNGQTFHLNIPDEKSQENHYTRRWKICQPWWSTKHKWHEWWWYSTRHPVDDDDLVEIPYPDLKEMCGLLLFMKEKNLQKLNGQCKNRCLESPLGISELLKMVKKTLYFLKKYTLPKSCLNCQKKNLGYTKNYEFLKTKPITINLKKQTHHEMIKTYIIETSWFLFSNKRGYKI